MSVSIEALAMAGANYLDYGMDIKEWERLASQLPPHLFLEEDDDDVGMERKNNSSPSAETCSSNDHDADEEEEEASAAGYPKCLRSMVWLTTSCRGHVVDEHEDGNREKTLNFQQLLPA
ncbi:uncharacterized protein LOC127803121 [Diospyros lotus]|uniref:uncharacterized protein LOC127803121 n=1 Tax=Diospyros lotus TaxID=55363 RepID=UPI00225114A7|nr:uncharacterized protein LOC127803121 [Diospyros lotus]